jgi:hypothetical protein
MGPGSHSGRESYYCIQLPRALLPRRWVNKDKTRAACSQYRMLVGIPYVTSGLPNRCRPCKLTQEWSDRRPISFALLSVVLAMGMVALVLLIYYLLQRWL